MRQYKITDLFGGQNLDVIAASLLLLGKLKVDSVEVFRDSPEVEVTLTGKFRSKQSKNTEDLVTFLNDHSDMSIDEILNAFKQRIKE